MKEAKQLYVDEAVKYGVDQALLINYLRLFIMGNRANGVHEYDGRTYTHATHQEIANRHPFWSKRKVSRLITSLVEDGVIAIGHFDKNPWDRTSYYGFVNEGDFLFDSGGKNGISDDDKNGISDDDKNGISTLYTKEQLKNTKERGSSKRAKKRNYTPAFDEAWRLYERRGVKGDAWDVWETLTADQHTAIIEAIPHYVRDQPDKQYRKHFHRWLEKDGWESYVGESIWRLDHHHTRAELAAYSGVDPSEYHLDLTRFEAVGENEQGETLYNWRTSKK